MGQPVRSATTSRRGGAERVGRAVRGAVRRHRLEPGLAQHPQQLRDRVHVVRRGRALHLAAARERHVAVEPAGGRVIAVLDPHHEVAETVLVVAHAPDQQRLGRGRGVEREAPARPQRGRDAREERAAVVVVAVAEAVAEAVGGVVRAGLDRERAHVAAAHADAARPVDAAPRRPSPRRRTPPRCRRRRRRTRDRPPARAHGGRSRTARRARGCRRAAAARARGTPPRRPSAPARRHAATARSRGRGRSPRTTREDVGSAESLGSSCQRETAARPWGGSETRVLRPPRGRRERQERPWRPGDENAEAAEASPASLAARFSACAAVPMHGG